MKHTRSSTVFGLVFFKSKSCIFFRYFDPIIILFFYTDKKNGMT